MNEENVVFDVVRYTDEAVTAGSVFSSPEEESVISVKAGDGNTYDVVAWGRDNQLPYELKEKVEKNSVMSQDKFFNVLTCYGRGLEYMDLATQGEKKPLPSKETDVRRFFIRNNLKRFFAEQITDLKYYFFCVCVVILNRERTKIVRLVHKDACHVRFQKADDMGRVRNIFFADWKDNDAPDNVEVVPLLDEYDPLGDLMARADKERDPLGVFKVMPRQYTKFAIVCKMPSIPANAAPLTRNMPWYTSTVTVELLPSANAWTIPQSSGADTTTSRSSWLSDVASAAAIVRRDTRKRSVASTRTPPSSNAMCTPRHSGRKLLSAEALNATCFNASANAFPSNVYVPTGAKALPSHDVLRRAAHASASAA